MRPPRGGARGRSLVLVLHRPVELAPLLGSGGASPHGATPASGSLRCRNESYNWIAVRNNLCGLSAEEREFSRASSRDAYSLGRAARPTRFRSMPVAGAWVRIRNGSETVASTRSGEDGSFHFHGLPRGRLIVEAGVHGWTTVSAGPRRADNIVFDCSAGGHCASVEFVLSRGGVITGRVVDEFGEPAIGAWVRLFAADPPDKAGSIAGVNTDDRGVYRFSAVGAGGYELNARIETMLTDKQGFQYAPASAAVEVEDNELTTAPTLVLRLVKKFRVSGRVESVSLGENSTDSREPRRSRRWTLAEAVFLRS